MLREMRSPTSPSSHSSHQEHIQRLLHSRAAQSAGVAELAQFPDTASIYSHGILSPHPPAQRDAFDYPPPANHRSLHHFLNNSHSALDDPQASSLDLDDEDDDDDDFLRSQSPPMTPVYDDDDDNQQGDGRDTDTAPQDSPESRMSMLGPKMRFHSPAPWELDQDPISEQEEIEDDSRSVVSKRGKGLFTKGEGFVKSFGLKSTVVGRPSLDSSRSSSGRDKKSFETASSYVSAGGALQCVTHHPIWLSPG
jgi:hypothetical protein